MSGATERDSTPRKTLALTLALVCAARSAIVFAVGSFVLFGCGRDRILPVDSVCGDGIVDGDEECDVTSPGCVDCRVTQGWQCPDDVCATICGDGIVAGTEACDPPDNVTCDDSCRLAAASTGDGCSLAGYFLVRQTDYSRDNVVNQVQTSNSWYFYRFAQTGGSVEVRQVLYCGYAANGTVNASLDDGGLRSLLYSTLQDPKSPYGARHGTFARRGDTCALTLERWYLIRGAPPGPFLPRDFSADPPLSALPPLPTAANSSEATDPDGDGRPGLALHITGNLTGLREVVQRDWDEYSTDDGTVIEPNALQFQARSKFDNEESVFSVGDCTGAICDLLKSGSSPAVDLPGHVTFRFLGTDLTDPRVAEVASGSPGDDADVDMATCAVVRAALPAETYVE